MKVRYWLYLCAGIFLVFALEFDMAERYNKSLGQKSNQPKNIVSVASSADATTADTNSQVASASAVPAGAGESPFYSQFLLSAQRISRTVADPKVVEKEIDDLALKMTEADIQKLSQVISDPQQEGDQRAMAVELLSRNKQPEAVQALNQFVSDFQNTDSRFNRQSEFETVLRAQAIEGIAAYPEKETALNYLDSLTKKVDESFLKDRLARSKENLVGRASAVEVQDNEALKKLAE